MDEGHRDPTNPEPGRKHSLGEGVARRDTYTADAVRDLGGERVGLEALIMAVPQYTALQTRNLMDMRGWSLDPDLILIAGPGAELDVSAYEDEVVTSVYRGLTDTHREMESVAIFRILDHWVRVKNGPKTQARDRVFGQQQGINPISDLGSAPMPTLDIWTPSFRLRESKRWR